MKHDVVYIVREGGNEELRYSLRSIAKNFPHERVWIFGGKPTGIAPFYFEPRRQDGPDKFWRVYNTFREVIWDARLTDDIWLFNDDFFVMKKLENPPHAIYHGTLQGRIDEIEKVTFGVHSYYSDKLREVMSILQQAGIEKPLNYETHTPILINRTKAIITLEDYPETPLFRSIYGNINHIGGEDRPDCKFFQERQPYPIGDYASTADESWQFDKIGEEIRKRFPEKSEFEE